MIRLAPGQPDCAAYELTQKGNIRLEMKFKQPLQTTVTAIVYSEHDDQLEIDYSRNILIDI